MHDRGLFAADTSLVSASMDGHISILIGPDFNYQVTSANISRVTPHLTAVKILLGWTLQGARCALRRNWLSFGTSQCFVPAPRRAPS
ncbi:hypothetical protein HPB48_026908 [Haemaphysalis longicornis]|uniref:Uncharacterized protein n=1 Tax=Haemaphysalis longicornis TaxID=44386 RepID=A0A9J6HAP2_HAELO|nr:hypothetical protein HPB48_026908 [Haemaphysalis longicornis]